MKAVRKKYECFVNFMFKLKLSNLFSQSALSQLKATYK